jgi:hypothetical protein
MVFSISVTAEFKASGPSCVCWDVWLPEGYRLKIVKIYWLNLGGTSRSTTNFRAECQDFDPWSVVAFSLWRESCVEIGGEYGRHVWRCASSHDLQLSLRRSSVTTCWDPANFCAAQVFTVLCATFSPTDRLSPLQLPPPCSRLLHSWQPNNPFWLACLSPFWTECICLRKALCRVQA